MTKTMPSAEMDLPLSARAPGLARHKLIDLMTAWDRKEPRDTAALMVTEVVTNAVRHSGSAPRLTVTATDGCLRCSVHDANPTHPAMRVPTPDRDGGRGLLIVAALASAWGVEDEPAGKSVWFELGA